MYNGHEYLSCIKIPATKQVTTKDMHKTEKAEMGFAANHRDLILTANKVFGENKWSHTVVSQTLDFIEVIGAKCCTGCVSTVKVQLDNGCFHEDIGYFIAEESTKGLSIHNARVGSAINALKRVLLSFGNKIERELRHLQKRIDPEQTNDLQKNTLPLPAKSIQEKSSISVKVPITSPMPQTECTSLEPKKDSDLSIMKEPNLISTANNATTESNPLSSAKIQNIKTDESSSNDKTNSINEEKPKQELSASEKQRMERKRKQMEKQMEFKRRMMEKEGLLSTSDNKPNPRY
ncbi:DNA repair protein RAD52 homolog [Pogonomyrmex barbatus]|uniref:DNA repair protein RAD52 homolog n=1 Tax=Pogonomyrmex barbatus TaxID=144034 RepID=A0A6I9WMT8_9HYME|nr:DNA repair protein RAD52 homolog [Pogonomyrmex barbatus]